MKRDAATVICPQCHHDEREDAGPAYYGRMARCKKCGYTCHSTHWKTPVEHDAREALVQEWMRDAR